MVEGRLYDESALGLQRFQDLVVCSLDVIAFEVWDFVCEPPSVVDWTWRNIILAQNTIGNSNAVIVLTKGRCLMYDTSTIGRRDICVDNNLERFVFKLRMVKLRHIATGGRLPFL